MLQTGLDCNLSNGQAGSDVAVVWDGANLLPRYPHTAIWRYYPRQQNGYYAVGWHSPNDGPGGWDDGAYSWGTHPYPVSPGSVNSEGARSGSYGSGDIHYWENAGVGVAEDWLTSPGGAGGLLVTKSQWYVQVRKCRIVPSGPDIGLTEHIFIPDLIGNPSFVIRTFYHEPITGNPVPGIYPSGAGAHPAFYIGASDWAASGSANDETVSGIIRGIQLYNDFLSDADHATEAANDSVNAAQTSAGQAALHYINQNPTPSDITDKKSGGTAHTPSWRNANRPILYSNTVPDVNTTSTAKLVIGRGRVNINRGYWRLR